jgi:hypothetical protein
VSLGVRFYLGVNGGRRAEVVGYKYVIENVCCSRILKRVPLLKCTRRLTRKENKCKKKSRFQMYTSAYPTLTRYAMPSSRFAFRNSSNLSHVSTTLNKSIRISNSPRPKSALFVQSIASNALVLKLTLCAKYTPRHKYTASNPPLSP